MGGLISGFEMINGGLVRGGLASYDTGACR
jgi:hypothetical protein